MKRSTVFWTPWFTSRNTKAHMNNGGGSLTHSNRHRFNLRTIKRIYHGIRSVVADENVTNNTQLNEQEWDSINHGLGIIQF